MEITIPTISFKDTAIVDSLPDKILLHKEYLEYKFKATLDQLNEDTKLREEKSYIGNICVLKNKIGGVEAYYSQTHERYQICVSIDGSDKVSPLFETFEEANKVKKQILNWLLEKGER